MKKKLFLTISVAFFAQTASAEWDFLSDTTIQGVHRNFPHGSSELADFKEGYLESSTGGRFSSENFQFEGRALVRSLQSPINTKTDDFAYPNLTPPRRLMKFYARPTGEDSQNQTIIDTGTLWASYSKDNWQVTAGRRAIGIGVLKSFPVWNRLYPVVPSLSGYMFVNNPDIFDVRWSKDKWTIAGFSIFSQYYDDYIGAVELIHYGENLEGHFLVGRWWDQGAIGYSGAMDSDYGIFRLETLAIADGGSSRQSGQQVGVGWEKAFTAKLSVNVEYYHSTFGESDPSEYLLQDPTSFRVLLASDYLYPQVAYKLTDFLSTELGAMTNLIDGSAMLINQTTYSFSDNIELFAAIRKPLGKEGEEFGHLTVPVTNQTIEYVEWATVGLKMTL